MNTLINLIAKGLTIWLHKPNLKHRPPRRKKHKFKSSILTKTKKNENH